MILGSLKLKNFRIHLRLGANIDAVVNGSRFDSERDKIVRDCLCFRCVFDSNHR